MAIEYAIVVKNKTRLESLIERFNTKAQAKFYIESSGGNFSDYEQEDAIFNDALNNLQTRLSKILKNKIIERSYLPSYLFAEKNVIIVIGQDGLVANTAKYANGRPIIAVNPDTKRYDGVLLPYDVSDFLGGVEDVLRGKFNQRIARFAEAKLQDGQRLLAFNDLFIGASTHVSARYKISFNKQAEEHSSSGLIVSTQAGASGWLSSIFNMAYGITGMFEENLTLKHPKLKDNQLIFAIREPFKSLKTDINITAGVINQKKVLRIESLMPNNGVIFSDGIESDYLKFNSGATATIQIAPETAQLVIKR